MRIKAVTGVLLACTGLGMPAYAQLSPEVPDAALERAIDRELFEAPAIDANAIDVSVSEGVATLTGEVGDILAHDRAIRVAQNTRGVVSVKDRLSVEETGRSDPNISADLLMAFSVDPATDSREIDVAIRDGEVTLTGAVQSAGESALATRVAKSVRGVRSVVNELRIEPRHSRSDAQIEPEVEELLRWAVRIADALIVRAMIRAAPNPWLETSPITTPKHPLGRLMRL